MNEREEKNFIEDSFRKYFSKDDVIAIYGLGRNTKTILDRCQEYNLVGLMDRDKTGSVVWGMPVITIERAHELSVNKIVIIAAQVNVPIIFRRIAEKSRDFGIEVYDILGERLEIERDEYQIDSSYSTISEENLKQLLEHYDVISFDIFDTLIVRNVLIPTDIFRIVERKKGYLLPEEVRFSETRIKCEMRLHALSGYPTIYDIYEEIGRETGCGDKILDILRESEIEEEKHALFARETMKNIVEYAIDNGKIVCCTSDMYIPENILKDILKNAGYPEFNRYFISCDYNVSKLNGLFLYLKEAFPNRRILHIGDNYEADIISAEKFGIEGSFQISSIYKMINDSACQKLLAYDTSLADRCEMGRLFSRQFNDPFLFSFSEGKCIVRDNYCIGYYFIEPLLSSFIEWMLAECQKDGIELLCLGSRDGYLIEKLLDIRSGFKKSNIPYKYIYASRFACTFAGMVTEDDVKSVYSNPYNGSATEMLITRFGFSPSELFEWGKNESEEEYLNRHIPIILKRSGKYRDNYREYFRKKVGLPGKTGFFDFVATGTCQLGFENICPETRWTGYYFIKTHDPNKARLDIKSYFNPVLPYEKQSRFSENYLFLEKIITSFEPCMKGFTSDGEVIFEAEHRSKIELDRLKELHKGIYDAYENRLSNGYGTSSKELSDNIVDLLNKEYTWMEASFFENNFLDDWYSNNNHDLKGFFASKMFHK